MLLHLTLGAVRSHHSKQDENEMGHEYDMVIGEEPAKTEQNLRSFNPSHKDQVIGVFSKGTPELADQAIRVAEEAFKTWATTPAEARAAVLLDTAKIIR